MPSFLRFLPFQTRDFNYSASLLIQPEPRIQSLTRKAYIVSPIVLLPLRRSVWPLPLNYTFGNNRHEHDYRCASFDCGQLLICTLLGPVWFCILCFLACCYIAWWCLVPCGTYTNTTVNAPISVTLTALE